MNLQIKNQGNYLSFKPEVPVVPPVIYNDQNYNVTEFRLYTKSLHTFAGQQADAEMIIVHTNTNSTKTLIVCIPIKKSGDTTAECAVFFDLMLAEVQRTANSKGQQTVYNNPTFSLGKFVPMTPYYSYMGTLPWSPCTGTNDYIVFRIADAITMTTSALTALQAVIPSPNKIRTKSNPEGIFFNPNGPIPPSAGQIYIECKPTGDDGEILVPARIDASGILDNQLLKRIFSSTLVKIFVGALVMLVIWKVSTKIFHGITENSAKMASAVINNAHKINL